MERNENLIVGLETSDDAGVYKLSDEVALIQTVDYFTPVVDDPYWYGQIAAANALSDIYAMGGRPLTVLNIAGFPVGKLPMSVLGDILRGAGDKTREAGAILLGGHSLEDQEPKFGLSVTGIVHPDQVLPNSGARPSNRLILTKPIGVGIVTTALKRDALSRSETEHVIQIMATLNDVVAEMHACGVRGCTDVTGFGLLGHASEMALAGGVGLRIWADKVPVLENTRAYAEAGFVPGGSKKNLSWLEDLVRFQPEIDPPTQLILCDAITSGGLLISVPEHQTAELVAALERRKTWAAAVIGEVVTDHPGLIEVFAS